MKRKWVKVFCGVCEKYEFSTSVSNDTFSTFGQFKLKKRNLKKKKIGCHFLNTYAIVGEINTEKTVSRIYLFHR